MLSSWMARVFLALALLQLVPVWAPSYFPTCDGPSHVYNAFVIRELMQGHDGPIATAYAIDWRPNPNILGHVALAALLGIFSAGVAEKILVSAIVLLFLLGAWMITRGSIHAFFAFPLAFHMMLQYGFYNFAISVGIYLVTLALWWERRDRPDGQTITLIAVMTLLCYFAHPMTTLLLIGSIGLLWLMTSRQPRHLLAFVPALPLLAWFFLQQGAGNVDWHAPLVQRLRNLSRIEILQTFDGVQLTFGRVLAVAIAALMVATVAVERRRRDEDAFLVLFFIVAILFLFAPPEASGGSFVPERLETIVPLLPLPWLTQRLWPPLRGALLAALSVAAAGNAWFLVKHEREIGRVVTAFVRAERTIPPRSTVLPLNGERMPPGTFLPLLAHPSGYVATERRDLDLDNYEATTGYFPVKRRAHAPAVDVGTVESDPANFDADTFTLADHVFVWHLPDNAPLFRRLERHYELTAISPDARIYRRRDADSAFYELLLPIAGTLRPVDGTAERWNVEQTIANRGERPLDVHLSACAGGPCDFVLGPGQARRVAADFAHQFVIARVAQQRERDLAVRTIVERIGNDGSRSTLAVPSIPLASFAQRSVDIAAVPLPHRLRLHVWIFGASPPEFDLGAYSEDGRTELKRLTIALPPNGAFTGDVAQLFAPLQGRVRLRVDAGSDAARVWAFVSETGSGHTADALYLPYHR